MTRRRHPLIEGETREDRQKRLRRDYYLANRERLLAKQAQYSSSPAGRASDRRKTAKIMALAKAIVADIEATPETDRPHLVNSLMNLGEAVWWVRVALTKWQVDNRIGHLLDPET